MKWLANVLDRIDDALDTVEERAGKKPKKRKSLTGTDSGGLYSQDPLSEQQQHLYVPHDVYSQMRAQPQHLDYGLGRLSDVPEASTEDFNERSKWNVYQGEHVTPSTDHVIREGIRPLTFNSTHSLDEQQSQTHTPPRPLTPISPDPPSTDFLDEYKMLDGVINSSPHFLADPRKGGTPRGRAAPAEGPRSNLSNNTDSKPANGRWGDEEPQFGPRKSYYTDDESSTHTLSPPHSPPHIEYSPATEHNYSQDEEEIERRPTTCNHNAYDERDRWKREEGEEEEEEEEGDNVSEPQSDTAPSPSHHTHHTDSRPNHYTATQASIPPQSRDLATRQKPPQLSRDSTTPREPGGRTVSESEGPLPSPVRARSLAAGVGAFSPSGKERERMEQTVDQQQAAHKDELARLTQSLQAVQAQGRQAEQARQQAQTEAEELRGRLQAARQQADRHKATATASQASILTLQQQLGQARSDAEKPRREVEELKGEVDSLKRQLEKAQAPREDGRMAELEQALALKDVDLRRLQDELQEARMQQRSQPREDARVAELEHTLARKDADLRRLQDDLQGARLQQRSQPRSQPREDGRVAELEHALALKNVDVRRLQDELQEARMQQRSQQRSQPREDGRMAELEQALALKDADLRRLQDELQEARLRQRPQPREQNSGRTSELEHLLASREAALDELSSELRDAEALAASLGASVADRAAAISQLTEELRERDTLVAGLRAQLAQAEGRCEDPEMLQSAHDELGRLQGILDQHEAVGAGREAEIEAMDRELEGLEMQLAGAVEQMTAAVEELRGAEDELRVRDRQLAGLYAQLADRDQALATLANELRAHGNDAHGDRENNNSSLMSLTAAMKDQTALLAHQARELEAREQRLIRLQEELQGAQARAKDAGGQNERVEQLEQWVERLRQRDRQQRAMIKQLKEQLATKVQTQPAHPEASPHQECEATARLVPIILV